MSNMMLWNKLWKNSVVPNWDPSYLLVSVMKVTKDNRISQNASSKVFSLTNTPNQFRLPQMYVNPRGLSTPGKANSSPSRAVSYLLEKGFDTIVCYSSIDWSFLQQRPQHMLRCFREMGFRIIYVEPTKYRVKIEQDELPHSQAIPLVLRERLPNLIQEVENDIFVVKPIKLIEDRHGRSVDVLKQYLELVIDLFSLSKYISWVLLQSWVPYITLHRSSVFQVFDCVDELTAFNPSPLAVSQEQLLARTSDIVLVTSKTLRESKSLYSQSVFHIPNGVNPDFFRESSPEPDDLKTVPHPRVGYVGALAGWVDLELIYKSALERPDWSFVIIGPSFTDIGRLSASNIHILGSKPYENLPAYYQHMDCGIVPFRVDHPAAYHSNPIKILEYLASGLPVISTPIPESIRMSPPVTVSDPDKFVQGIENTLSKRHKQHCFAGHIEHFLSLLTWKTLATTACNIIAAKIAASENRFGLGRDLLRSVLPFAYDKAGIHSEIRLYERLECVPNRHVSDKTVIYANQLERVQILGKRPYCIMLFPDWAHPNRPWINTFQALIQLLAHNDRITLAVRANPNQVSANNAAIILSHLVSEVTGEETEFCKNIVIVDNPLESDGLYRLLVSVDAVLVPYSDIGANYMKQVIATARTLGVRLFTINPKTPKRFTILNNF